LARIEKRRRREKGKFSRRTKRGASDKTHPVEEQLPRAISVDSIAKRFKTGGKRLRWLDCIKNRARRSTNLIPRRERGRETQWMSQRCLCRGTDKRQGPRECLQGSPRPRVAGLVSAARPGRRAGASARAGFSAQPGCAVKSGRQFQTVVPAEQQSALES